MANIQLAYKAEDINAAIGLALNGKTNGSFEVSISADNWIPISSGSSDSGYGLYKLTVKGTGSANVGKHPQVIVIDTQGVQNAAVIKYNTVENETNFTVYSNVQISGTIVVIGSIKINTSSGDVAINNTNN